MKFANKSTINNIVNRATGWNSYRAKSIINDARTFSRSSYTSSIFLSHSHLDADIIESIVVFLRSVGVNVYVDWMDDTMPRNTSGETASRLKSKIKINDKFIFLATNNSLESKWCNWEIGYGDANKYIDNIAIFPFIKDDGYWNGQEYLQIYPSIQQTDYNEDFYVVYPDGRKETFNNWLKK